MSKPKVKIENWEMFEIYGERVLSGDVMGHPRFIDNTSITTSKIISLSGEIGKACEVETRNTIYILGNKK